MSLPVRITPEADAQVRDIDRWWRTNRPSSPDLFLNELSEAFGSLATRHRSAGCIDSRRYRARDACY